MGSSQQSCKLILKPISKYLPGTQSRRSLLSVLQTSSYSPQKAFLKKEFQGNLAPTSSSSNLLNPLKPVKKPIHLSLDKPAKKMPLIHHRSKNSFCIDTIREEIPNQPETLQKVVTHIVSKSVAGNVRGKVKKQNQDSLFAISNFNGVLSQVLLGVMDGHGVYGSQVSQYVKSGIPMNFQRILNANGKKQLGSKKCDISASVASDAFTEAYEFTHSELKKVKDIDVNFSGTTAVSVFISGKSCICANCGDSRAVIGRITRTGWEAIALTKDHKPDVPEERERIERNNGVIHPYSQPGLGYIGPNRVWLKHQEIPGLAMSRSIGDLVAGQAGVIPSPDVKVFQLTPSDKFIILASDGIWEFVSNEECVTIAANFCITGKFAAACEQIVELALCRWNQEDTSVDDITIIIAGLKVKD